jgi:hypothetical protein
VSFQTDAYFISTPNPNVGTNQDQPGGTHPLAGNIVPYPKILRLFFKSKGTIHTPFKRKEGMPIVVV